MSAVISADTWYRYRLTRDIGMMGDGAVCFVMLNPSIADATNDDPTIRRCIGYARTWNCARLEVVNLFAYRSTDPAALYGPPCIDVVGVENDRHIAEACKESRIIICAWGNHGALHRRGNSVLKDIRAQGCIPMALKINEKSGQPSHPLYLRADATPRPMP